MFRRFLLLFCLLCCTPAWAAFDPVGISLAAHVNKTSLTMDDELKLTVTVDGAAGDITPTLPSLPAFNVFMSSSARQINNFHATSTFEYVMLPRFPGQAVIGPISLHYGNKMYQTEPITVTVYRATQAPARPPAAKAPSGAAASARKAAPVAQAPANMPPLERDLYNLAARQGQKMFFMVAAASDKNPYVNQTVLLGVRFYYARPFVDNAPYSAPTPSNLFMEEISTSEGQQIIDGKTYSYMEKRYALSGVSAGPATAGAASVKYIPAGRLDLSMFDRMFASLSQEAQLVQSNPVSFTIRPVPAPNRPASFYGAVGTGYTVSASLDRSEVEAGEAVNLTVKVNGPGNLKPTAELKIPPLNGFKVYDVVATSGSVPGNGTLKSYKIFKTVLVPVSSGLYQIPPLAWSYYDPAAQTYRTLLTQPLSLRVTPSSKVDSGFDFATQTDLNGGLRTLGTDIRYLKTHPFEGQADFLARLGRSSAGNIAFGLLLLACALYALTDKQTWAGKRSVSKARANLKRAESPEAVAEALSTYLSVRYGVHTASLPLRDIAAALQARGCPAVLLASFETLWKQLDAARFAPVDLQGQGTASLARRAAQWISDMEKGKRK